MLKTDTTKFPDYHYSLKQCCVETVKNQTGETYEEKELNCARCGQSLVYHLATGWRNPLADVSTRHNAEVLKKQAANEIREGLERLS